MCLKAYITGEHYRMTVRAWKSRTWSEINPSKTDTQLGDSQGPTGSPISQVSTEEQMAAPVGPILMPSAWKSALSQLETLAIPDGSNFLLGLWWKINLQTIKIHNAANS